MVRVIGLKLFRVKMAQYGRNIDYKSTLLFLCSFFATILILQLELLLQLSFLTRFVHSIQNASMDDEALESLGRVRPSIFSNGAAELGFCFSLILSQIMAVSFVLVEVLFPQLSHVAHLGRTGILHIWIQRSSTILGRGHRHSRTLCKLAIKRIRANHW